jgi:TPR repeat protein
LSIAWGDADALAEAGFCYAQGQGCKKDLKKSAKFYRQAEAKGISMVGNSWIYKPKYNDDTDIQKPASNTNLSPEKEKKPRNKSRTIFGRKKSEQ